MTSDNQDRKITSKTDRFRIVGNYVLGYLFFAIFLFLLVFLLFRIRANVIQIAFLLGNNEVKVKGISNLAVLFSAIIMLAGIVFSEDYLRKGIAQNRMWKHILRIFIVTGSAILVSLGLYYALMLIFG
ncbi:MAG: hypothetical protein LLG42_07410 [Chloroflexi bacterium]|nr:hypothetical protein [Chloroflexota bacterium]